MSDTIASIQKIDQAHLTLDIPLKSLPTTITQYQPNVSSTKTNEGNSSSTHSIRVSQPISSLITLDDNNLISLGYKPVMSRSLSWISMTGVAMTASNVLCGVVALYGHPLTNGGPAWVTWSYLTIGIMSCIVSFCLAELAAAYPTTAGVHHWVYQLASSRQKPFLTWITGWLTLVGTVASASSVAFYFSSVLGQVLYSIYKIALTPGMLVMFHLGAVLFWQAFNLFPVKGLGYISTLGGLYIFGVAVTTTVVMLSHSLVDATLVHVPFTVFLNYSGNSNAVYASLSSALMASFIFCPQDSVIRMSEETQRPERIVPKLIIGSNMIGLILGLPLVIVLNYGILQPMKGLLDEAAPAVRVILVTLGRPLGPLFVSLIISGIFFTGLVRLSMATRVAYAFSRDAGFPKSLYWSHLHTRRKTPQRISWLVAAACMSGIFPFYWGDNNAFHWIASLACIATNLSIVIPLWVRLTREGSLNYTPGPFTLGSLSRFLYTVSVLWLLFLSAILMLPATFPLTRGNFNYAPVAILVIVMLASFSWLKAKYSFTGAPKEGSRAASRIATSPFRRFNHVTLTSFYSQDHQLHECPSQNHQHRDSQKMEHRFISSPTLLPLSVSLTRSSNGGISFTSMHERGRRLSNTGSVQARSPTEESRFSRDQSLSRSFGTSIASSRSPTYSHSQRQSHGHQSYTSDHLPSRTQESTMATILSASRSHSHQTQTVSILGLPLNNSPEIAHRELNGALSSVASSSQNRLSYNKSSCRSHYEASDGQSSPSLSPVLKVIESGLLESYYRVPEISIAPPTTISSCDDSCASSRIQSPSQTTMTDAQISDHLLREGSMNGSTLSYLPDREPKPRAGMPSPPLIRPPSAIESIFPELSPTTPSSSRSSRYVKDVNSAENIGESDYFAITKTDDFLATDGLEIAINDTQISTNPGKSITRPRAKRRHANLPAPLIIPTPSSTFASIHKFENSSDTVKKDSSKQPVVTPGDESTIKIKDLGVDDSFDEEYHHQYPAISAYQSAQGLFNVLPSPKSVSYQEMTSLLRQSMTPSPVSDINWEGHSFKDLSGDDYRTILNTGPLNIPAVTESRNDEEQTSRSPFNDKNQVVAKWAHEQAKIHEWRMEKKRVQALRGIRKTGSTSSADLKSWEDSISDPEHTSGEQETIVPVFDKGYSEI